MEPLKWNMVLSNQIELFIETGQCFYDVGIFYTQQELILKIQENMAQIID